MVKWVWSKVLQLSQVKLTSSFSSEFQAGLFQSHIHVSSLDSDYYHQRISGIALPVLVKIKIGSNHVRLWTKHTNYNSSCHSGKFSLGVHFYQFCEWLHKLRLRDKTNLVQLWIAWYHLFSCHPDSRFPGRQDGMLLCFQYLFHVGLEGVGRIPEPFRFYVGSSTVIRFEIRMLLITMLKI